MKIKDFIKKYKNMIVPAAIAFVVLLSVIVSFVAAGSASGKKREFVIDSNVNPRYRDVASNAFDAPTTEPPAHIVEDTGLTEKPSTEPTAEGESTSATDVSLPYATAETREEPADYEEQWDLGYLIAIDNPDPDYSCDEVKLTKEDRDLLERLCMGEFGSGGFVGACLIAQAVKDAMYFDGYKTVEDVIRECRYTGSTDVGTNNDCRQAVHYIFDENHDAVQHRILYMYNPHLVESSFHESQRFILSYDGVRFFDR